jgi:hypothetical protein
MIDRIILPRLGSKKVAAVQSSEIQSLQDAVSRRKVGMADGQPSPGGPVRGPVSSPQGLSAFLRVFERAPSELEVIKARRCKYELFARGLKLTPPKPQWL